MGGRDALRRAVAPAQSRMVQMDAEADDSRGGYYEDPTFFGLDSFAFPAVLIDADGTIVLVNRAWGDAALAMGAVRGETGVGVSYLDVCRGATGPDAENAALIHEGICEVLRGASSHFVGEYACAVGGRTRWYVMSCSRLPRRLPGATIAHLEITPWKRREAKTDEVFRAQSSFVANVGHDLRTPINIIMGYREMLADSRLADEQRELLDRIQAAALSLKILVDDLVDYAKVNTGTIDIRERPFLVTEMLDSGVAPLLDDARARGLDATMYVAPGLAESVLVGDPERIRQVLANIVGNAVKFTAKGHLHVKVLASRALLDGIQVQFQVEDSGSGIPAAALADIFEPFYQREARHLSGVGLGLAISRKIVQQLGGEIGVDSEPGRGSTFWFTVPLRLDAASATTAEEAQPQSAPMRVR